MSAFAWRLTGTPPSDILEVMGLHTLGPWRELPWFLVTPPMPGPHTLLRPRLVSALDQQTRRTPITLLCAPSGFGKTAAAAEWARTRDDAQWVSAVRSADTEHLIRGGLLAGLSAQARALFTRVEPEEQSPGILELIAELRTPLVIVVDDAHLLDADTLRTVALEDAVLRSGMLRLVLVGQPALTSQYGFELATGTAGVIGAEDLALTEHETADLLALTSTTAAPEERWAMAVHQRSGGWAMAVLLAARAHAEPRSGQPSLAHSSDVVEGNADSLLTDYIESAVLSGLSTELAAFVLDTTTCTRLDARLAEGLSGRPDSAALLERCVAQGMFLARSETRSGRVMYRWHDMFAHHCQLILARRDPARARRLHRTAAGLLSGTFPAEAGRHALQADVPEMAANIIAQNWLHLILDGQASTLHSLCARLPPSWKDRPHLMLVRACCADLMGDHHAAALLRERALRSASASAAEAEGPRAGGRELEYVQSFAEVLLTPDPERKAIAADAAHEMLRTGTLGDADPHALFVLGWAELRLRRDPERAIEVLTAAWHEARRLEHRTLALKAQENATFATAYAGEFTQAKQLLNALDESRPGGQTEWQRYDGGLRGLAQGYIDYWRGDYRMALAHCDQTIAEGGADTSFLGLAHVYRVLTVAALEEEHLYASAERTLEDIPEHDKHGVPWGAYRRMAGARLLEVQGRHAEARRLADPLLNRSRIPVTHALLADFYRRVRQPSLAFLALSKIKRRERPRYARVSSLVTFAALKFAAEDSSAAHHHLERALEYAAKEGALAPFLSSDNQLTMLLEAHARSGTPHEALLAEIFSRRDRAAGVDLASKLTHREQELLGFLRTTMTAQEIADALHLSLATVKTHQRTLYRKLGVHNRRGAVRAAQHHVAAVPER